MCVLHQQRIIYFPLEIGRSKRVNYTGGGAISFPEENELSPTTVSSPLLSSLLCYGVYLFAAWATHPAIHPRPTPEKYEKTISQFRRVLQVFCHQTHASLICAPSMWQGWCGAEAGHRKILRKAWLGGWVDLQRFHRSRPCSGSTRRYPFYFPGSKFSLPKYMFTPLKLKFTSEVKIYF